MWRGSDGASQPLEREQPVEPGDGLGFFAVPGREVVLEAYGALGDEAAGADRAAVGEVAAAAGEPGAGVVAKLRACSAWRVGAGMAAPGGPGIGPTS